jgi:hypothetical protein
LDELRIKLSLIIKNLLFFGGGEGSLNELNLCKENNLKIFNFE